MLPGSSAAREKDLPELIREVWEREIKPKLQADTDELNRRLARRRNGMMNRPPRAWCLAVRSADTRIALATARVEPEMAAYPRELVADREHAYGRHKVTLDARLLRKLCAPVYTDSPYTTVRDMMARLGCSLHNIRAAIKCGALKLRKIQNLGGQWGHPVPVVYSREPLDPGSRLREHADIVWGTMWRYVSDHIPEDLSQTIERVPWYSPRFHRKEYAPHGVFCGWKWICPACGKSCRTIFYPLPPLYSVRLLAREVDEDDADAVSTFNNTFACMTCHQVMYHSRLDAETWNRLVAHLSGGLVYGHEVKRPAWYGQKRKRAWHAILRRAPSARREQLLPMLLEGKGVTQIALELGLAKSTAGTYASKIYRQHGVKSQKELIELYERRNGVRVAA